MGKFIFLINLLYAFSATADDNNTVIYGASETAPGVYDSATVQMTPNEGNIMGQPIVGDGFQSAMDNASSDASDETATDNLSTTNVSKPSQMMPSNVVSEALPQNPQISPQESPQAVNQQIQNTLYESGGRIYDVQSYPASDVNTIEEPNIQSTITTYPSY